MDCLLMRENCRREVDDRRGARTRREQPMAALVQRVCALELPEQRTTGGAALVNCFGGRGVGVCGVGFAPASLTDLPDPRDSSTTWASHRSCQQ
jgi:hypothetical protein